MLGFKKEEKKEESSSYEVSDASAERIENIVKVAAIFGVFIFLLIAGASMKGEVKKPIGNAGLNGDKIIALFDKISSNYSLDVTKEINDSKTVIKYITDGTFDLYNINDSKDGYLLYNGKTYTINNDNFNIKEYNGSLDVIHDKYIDIKLIKNIVSYCDMEIESTSKAVCTIKFGDFITKYNEMYNTEYEYSGENTFKMNIKFDSLITDVEVDFTDIYNYINESNDLVKYSYHLHNYNLNNFSAFYDIYSDTIKKQ